MESLPVQKRARVLNHDQDKNDTLAANNKIKNNNTVRIEEDYTKTLGDNSMNDYKRAVCEHYSLMENIETMAIQSREEQKLLKVPNMNRFISRSGLTESEVDELSFIHVSGTKGKGSTCAFVERILNAKGYKTGFFSSPHLVEVRERFRINGRPISRGAYVKHFWKVYSNLRATAKGEDDMPDFFNFNTILCLHIFKAEKVDVIVLEVGIGGEYDSTNFVRHPAACGVTSLGLDHTSLLGNTLEEIAWNKAGIFKSGRPAMAMLQSPSCMEVLVDRAKEKQSPFYYVPVMPQELLSKGNFHLGIAGTKQISNASLALHLARTWEKTHHKDTLPCNVDGITSSEDIPELKTTELTPSEIKGLSSCVWPGRAQTISRPGITYYLDGAHTKESMEVCSEWFNRASREEEKLLSGKVVRLLLFNVTGDRDVNILLATLKRICTFDAAVFTTNRVSTVPAYHVADQTMRGLTMLDMIKTTESNKAQWESILTEDDESPSSTDDRTREVNGDENGFGYSSKASSTLKAGPQQHVSCSFPCVLQALSWATQLKDPGVKVVDTDATLPPIPTELSDADHIQILVTGSLHLVGVTLAVLDPNMND